MKDLKEEAIVLEKIKKERIINDLTLGSVPKQLLIFAAPLFLSGLLQTVYSMVDMVVVGQYIGKNGLSAVSIGGDILHMLTFIAMGISNAGQIIMSQYVGAKKYDLLSKMIGTLFTFLLTIACVMMVMCLILKDKILYWVNTPPEVFAHAESYLTICVLGLIFIYGYNLISALLRGMGDSKHPFMFIAIASALNLILDYIFIIGFNLGTMGAALATVISQGVSFVCALVFLYKNKRDFYFEFRKEDFRIHPIVFKPLMLLGIPMVFQSAAISFSKIFISSWINSYGVITSALTGIGNKLQTVTNVFAHALSTAGGSMIAQNIGGHKYDRIPKIINTSFIGNSCIVIVISILTLIFREQVFGLFTSDADVLAMSSMYLPVAILLYCSCALRPPMLSLINGTRNSKLNLTIAVLDGIVIRIGFAYFLGVICQFGIQGFWYGNALSSFTPFIVGLPYYLSGKWKEKTAMEKQEENAISDEIHEVNDQNNEENSKSESSNQTETCTH